MPPNKWGLNICVFTTDSRNILFNAIEKESLRGGTVRGGGAGPWCICLFSLLKVPFWIWNTTLEILPHQNSMRKMFCLNLSKNHFFFSSAYFYCFFLLNDFIPTLKLLCFWSVVTGGSPRKVGCWCRCWEAVTRAGEGAALVLPGPSDAPKELMS